MWLKVRIFELCPFYVKCTNPTQEKSLIRPVPAALTCLLAKKAEINDRIETKKACYCCRNMLNFSLWQTQQQL